MIRGRIAALSAARSAFFFLRGSLALPKPPARPPATPGPKDKAALHLDEEALGKDYLETNFAKAEKKLQQALSLCDGKDACSDRVHSQLPRDLAGVYLAG